MNRAFCIILIPAFLVAIGYVFVFRVMGVAPPYWLMSFGLILFVGALWWVGRKAARKAGSGA